MLVVTRKEEETIEIDGGRIIIKVFGIKTSRVKLGITAPGLTILRGELVERGKREPGA